MRRLVRFVRQFGLRDGWLIWRIDLGLRLDANLPSLPRIQIHHGAKPSMPGYRRRTR